MIASPDRTPLPRDFFDRPVLAVAPDLLGRTPRNDVVFGPPERVYVYFTYGMSRQSA